MKNKFKLLPPVLVAVAAVAIHAAIAQRQVSPELRAAVIRSLEDSRESPTLTLLEAKTAAHTRKDHEFVAKMERCQQIEKQHASGAMNDQDFLLSAAEEGKLYASMRKDLGLTVPVALKDGGDD